MIVPLLFVFCLIVGISALMYRGSVQEFQVLQKEYKHNQPWSEILGEQLPLVVRTLPNSWMGAWTHAQTASKSWELHVKEHEQTFRTTWATWVADPQGVPDLEPLAEVSKLNESVQQWMNEGFRRWSWLPSHVQTATPRLLRTGEIVPVQQHRAAFTAFVATDGPPLILWIAHEGAVPANTANELRGKDPWIQTVKEIPWIGEVKYIEVKLRPGNAILIPSHWWVAVKPVESKESVLSWYWTAEFHTPISWVVSRYKK
jgi:hypothetical protein